MISFSFACDFWTGWPPEYSGSITKWKQNKCSLGLLSTLNWNCFNMQRISQKSCQSAYEVTGLLLFDHSPVHHQNLEAQAHHLFHCYPDNKETDIFSTFFHLLHPPPLVHRVLEMSGKTYAIFPFYLTILEFRSLLHNKLMNENNHWDLCIWIWIFFAGEGGGEERREENYRKTLKQDWN